MSRVFGAFWRGLNLTRQVILNLVFFLLLFIVIVAMFAGEAPSVPQSGALVVEPQGLLVEQLSVNAVEQALNEALGQGQKQTLLRQVTGAIRTAAKDKRINALVLKLDNFAGGALPQLREVALAIDTFKESGKPVVAVGDSYTQSQYFIASHADTIMMHPLGGVVLQGLGFNQLYYKELSNKLGVDWNVVRVGDFKSAVEPMIRNDMSPEARKNYANLLGDLWAAYQAEVTQVRELPESALDDYIGNLVESLRKLEGNAAELALSSGLVDQLADRETMRQHIIDIVGEDGEDGSYSHIHADVYYKLHQPQRILAKATKPRVAVIVASGVIMPGHSGPNRIGADDLAARINDAATDDSVKAIVLRVHSPGGSAFASEIIHDAVMAAKADGKPVVVSMSGLAASGGYWISLGADRIFAYPGTITGSIGVFGRFPTLEQSLEKIGIHTDSVATNWLANEFSVVKNLSPKAQQLSEISVQHIYRKFVGRVMEFRELAVDNVETIAGGRVWSGMDALEIGLVDKLGNLNNAVDAAAEMAGIADKYAVDYRERKLTFTEQLVIGMLSAEIPGMTNLVSAFTPEMPLRSLLAKTSKLEEVKFLLETADERMIYAYCFCAVTW